MVECEVCPSSPQQEQPLMGAWVPVSSVTSDSSWGKGVWLLQSHPLAMSTAAGKPAPKQERFAWGVPRCHLRKIKMKLSSNVLPALNAPWLQSQEPAAGSTPTTKPVNKI